MNNLLDGVRCGSQALRIRRTSPREDVMYGLRLEICGVVDAHPGIHFRGIQRETGIPARNAGNHLSVLERLDYVFAREIGPKRCYVTRLRHLEGLGESRFYLERESVRSVLEAVEAEPEVRQCDDMAALPGVAS